MKFASFLPLLCLPVATALVNSGKDRQSGTVLGGAMWVFNGDGLSVYSSDGAAIKKSVPATKICHSVAGYSGEAPSLSCAFYDVISDGKKYVWAAVSRGVSKVDVFDIDTGEIAGSFETCKSPRDLEYHSLRDEIWVRCAEHDEEHAYMNAISASSPSGTNPSNITFQDNTTLSSWGYTAVDNSLGDIAYSTDFHSNKIFKIDLSAKSVIDSFEVPNAYGTYELAYSRVNQHVYVRASTCCTCGFAGADLGEVCGRYANGPVDIKTGPFAGSVNISGLCGRCDGTLADTIGVVELDSNTDTVVGNHLMKEGFGGDPFASPDGKYIILFARNGGKTIRILEAQGMGQKSTVAFDLELDFEFGDNTDDQVFNDFAFIQDENTNMIIFASGTQNKLAFVDLTTSTPTVSYATFGGEELSSNRNRRQVEWAVGTQYVWVDGTAVDELYVFDVKTKSLVRTITGVDSTKLVFVDNYERKRTAELLASMIADNVVSDGNADVDSSSADGGSVVGANAANNMSRNNYSDDSDIDGVGVAALVLASLAMIIGIANLMSMKSNKEAPPANVESSTKEVAMADGEFSVGSKNVA